MVTSITQENVVPASQASPIARRQRTLLIITSVAALASTAGLIASTQIKSPAQVAADTNPPVPTILTATVARRVLSTTLVMRGTASQGRSIRFSPTSAAPSLNGPAPASLVITALKTHLGAAVKAGQVVIEVSERPVFVLPGAFPAYRDMAPGETGKDIGQLRKALSQLGCPSWDKSDFFGPSTKMAVKCFYKLIHYPQALVSVPSSGPVMPDSIVPMSEVVFLPKLPARVSTIGGQIGDSVTDPLIAFTTGNLALTARLDPSAIALVKPGMKVSILSEATGFATSGQIQHIGTPTTPANSSGLAPFVPLRIVTTRPLPLSLNGEDVRVTITTASTKQAVIAVPEAAVSTSVDGRTTVTLLDSKGDRRVAPVTTGVSADGWIQVSSIDGVVKPGAVVITGQ
jgi:hypothetical protein